jgi:hypothetical protein
MNEDILNIREHCLSEAKELLNTTGEFYPIGGYVYTGVGTVVRFLEFEHDPKNAPKQGEVVDSLKIYCEKERVEGRIKAWGLAYEVSIQLSSDEPATSAIAIQITHSDEEDIPMFYLPYNTEGKIVEYQEIFAVAK